MANTQQIHALEVHPFSSQAAGEFDGGRITEHKPIGFPGEGSTVSRMGPLFYWAWASSHADATIALHPHKGFEIMSYVLRGEIGHYDTLGTRSRVAEGGAQVMQTGSGVAHEERMFGDSGEFFQIWFEPWLDEAVTRPPTYREVASDEFAVNESNGVRVKSILGPASPVDLVVDARADDVTIEPERAHAITLAAGRSLAVVVIDGEGRVEMSGEEHRQIQTRDFVVAYATDDRTVIFSADTQSPLRLFVVEVPSDVDYPLLNG
jgi:redox-sensitive bicupin YhaK (pirin superfamily)